MSDRFCLECNCKGEPLDLGDGKTHEEKNWECPLIKGKICETCCHDELAGGMGAPDTLQEMVVKTGKSTAQILATCVACEHGGPGLLEPHSLIMARGADGTMKTCGPEFEAADAEFKRSWNAKLEILKEDSMDRQLDTIFSWADTLMTAGRFEYLDAAIAAFHPDEMPTDHLLGILTATRAGKSKLPSRGNFYKDVERIITARGQMEPGLLIGLEQ